MRKSLCLLLICILLLLTGCSGDSGGRDGNSGPVALTIWHDKEPAVIAVLEEAVQELAPDITVTFEKKTGRGASEKACGRINFMYCAGRRALASEPSATVRRHRAR